MSSTHLPLRRLPGRSSPFLALALVLTLALPSSSHLRAGGPLEVCVSGLPVLWPNGGVRIPFHPDLGPLGPLDNTAAVALVRESFDVWEAVPTSTISFVNAGPLPVDVDGSNFADYLFAPAPDGRNAIVFDDTGEIFDLLFGPNSGILGFAGPEWIDYSTCHIVEGLAFLNGPAFTDPVAAKDVMVHEFGHFAGLAHSVVNGQIYLGDESGPSPFNAFGSAPDPFSEDVVETMYPFYFGPGVQSMTLHADDLAVISAFYPEPDFASNSASISGRILASNAATPLTGINVIARNIHDPFRDAVSSISGDLSLFFDPTDPLQGVYSLRGLTPGASYAVYTDQILDGGFSTPPISIPGPEEFYNGPLESNGIDVADDPSDFTTLSPVAGVVTSDIDLIVNTVPPNQPLPLGDDGSLEIFLPFPFTVCGQSFRSVWINANGSLTFGFPDASPFASAAAFLAGPPRIAALWSDLNPAAGGTIVYDFTPNTFTVIWANVPAFPADGANSFSITLNRTGNSVSSTYGALTARSGLAGLSGGFAITSGLESPTDLRPPAQLRSRLALWSQPAIYEEFTENFDLSGLTCRYQHEIDYSDRWAGANDSPASATPISLPFHSGLIRSLTEIEPAGADVDFFRFHASTFQTIKATITQAGFDTVLGIFSPAGELLAFNDDSGPSLLSTLSWVAPQDGDYLVAVSSYPDTDFSGDGAGSGRYVLDVQSKSCGIPAPPSPANWLVNGGFELGNLSGWSAADTDVPYLDWTAADDSRLGFFSAFIPPEGCYLAANGFDGCGPMQSTLHQDVTLPADLPFLTLEWSDRLQWDLLNFGASLDRSYSVEILDPTSGALLETVHSLVATAGSLGDTGWQSHSVDLSPYIGRSIRLLFRQDIPECFFGPGQFELDDVRLRSE